MLRKYLNFMRGISVNWPGRTGVVLVTSSFITFIILELGRLGGLFTNAYLGLITYLVFPALFISGLLLIPAGWFLFRRKSGKSTRELLNERFDPAYLQSGIFGSSIFMIMGILTVLNVIFMGGASMQMTHFMDSARFCGTACHTVMNPEWSTYQVSAHARVPCVKCHVGEGMKALLNSKLNGLWQIISVTFNLYERPIPTPIHNLRPARETCEKCHWPEKFYGNRLRTFVNHADDENSNPLYSTVNLKIDAGKRGLKAGIHWHVGKENVVRYASLGDEREKMVWVEVRQPGGQFRRFTNKAFQERGGDTVSVRTMDCVDCHNRATHVYEDPEDAVNDRIQRGLITRSLPFIKRESLEALTFHYADAEAAMQGIRNHLTGYYKRNHPDVSLNRSDQIDTVISVLQHIYNRNIHHQMNIGWGSYPSHIGHKTGSGCFRCHNANLVDNQGRKITEDCTLCHSILSNRENEPFKYIKPLNRKDPDFKMHEYLRDEFLEYSSGTY